MPLALRGRFGCRELKISLRTSDPIVARIRGRQLANVYEVLINSVAAMPELPTQKIDELVRDYFRDLWAEAEEAAFLLPLDPKVDLRHEAESLDENRAEAESEAGSRRYSNLTQIQIQDILDRAGISLPPRTAESYHRMAVGVLRARAEQARILQAMLRGRYAEAVPYDPLFKEISSPGMRPIDGEPTEQRSVAVLVERYCSQKQKEKAWVHKTYLDNVRVLGWFKDVVGADRAIESVTLDHVREFRDVVQEIPKSFAITKAYQGMSVVQVVKSAGSGAAISVLTARKYFDNLKAFLKWCVDEGYLDKAPVGGLSVKGKASPEAARLPFTKVELKKLFSSPQYVGHLSASRRSDPGSMIQKDGKYWIPLVALFTGLRLGEIVQLRCADINVADPVPQIAVRWDEEGKNQIKTDSSVRVVPLHPVLIDIGFREFASGRQKADPKGRVFHEIEPGKDGYHSHNFSKYFARYLDKIGLKHPKLTFHSFRHNMADALRNAGVEEIRIKAILGHSDTSVTGGYGLGYQAEVLYADVKKIEYSIEFDHLKG